MIASLARPLPPARLLLAAAAICLFIAVYCLAYSALAGRPESAGQAIGWALVNILPWLLALEAGKRTSHLRGCLLAIAAAFAGSMLLGVLLQGMGEGIVFEAWRRVPAVAATAALLALLHFIAGRKPAGEDMSVELPLLPEQIEWVSAAGNYIEIRSAGRTLIRRASLGAAERELLDHGFVRIHRSTLVRRDRIARIRPADVVLHDGTSLKTGNRYRASLAN